MIKHSVFAESTPLPPEPHSLRVLAGGCGVGIGLGLIRSDFGVIGREMVVQGWIPQSDLGDLAALNMVGYVLGCVHQAQLQGKAQLLRSLRIALIAAVVCLWLGAIQSGELGEGGLRVLAGWSAGHLMSGLPGLAIAGVPARRQRQAVAVVLGGGALVALLGAGAVAWLAPRSAAGAWVVMATFATGLAIPTLWLVARGQRRLRAMELRGEERQLAIADAGVSRIHWAPLIALAMGFVLTGAAQVPMALYEPLVASDRVGLSASMSSASFGVMGFGGLVAALLVFTLPRAWPTALLLPGVALVGAAGAWLYAAARTPQQLLLAAFLIGLWSIMTSSLTLDRLPALVPADLQRRCWATLTTLNGLGFVLFSMGTSSLAQSTLVPLLWLGLGVMILQLLMEVLQIRQTTGSNSGD